MTRLGLTPSEAKTSLKNARQERFDFLGYSFGPHRYKANGSWYLSASPSKKSMQRFKTKDFCLGTRRSAMYFRQASASPRDSHAVSGTTWSSTKDGGAGWGSTVDWWCNYRRLWKFVE
jgi:hypothetical protein